MLNRLISKLLGLRPDANTLKVGLALGGGGARGFVHLGIAQGLREKGVNPSVISGTSAGAIVGAFLAAGKAPKDILDLLKAKSLFSYSKIHWPRHGLFKLDGLSSMIRSEIPFQNIEDLPTPLVVASCSMNSGKVRYFDSGNLAEIITASSSIPFIFKPVTIEGEKYVDGGVMDNLPVKPLLNRANEIIAVNISPIEEIEKIDNLVSIATRTFQMSVNAQMLTKKEDCTLYIEPRGIRGYDIFDLKKADELYDLGLQYIESIDLEELSFL